MPKFRLGIPLALALMLVAGTSFAQLSPLSSGTVGPSPSGVSPTSLSLEVDGAVNLGYPYGFLFQGSIPLLHTLGGVLGHNTAVGLYALKDTAADYGSGHGVSNTAIGSLALYLNTTGTGNTATGAYALNATTTGYANTALGAYAMRNNSTGSKNTGVGFGALPNNTSGGYNTAVGVSSMSLTTTGLRNVALGHLAGQQNTTGSNNIWIANTGAIESNTLRIGSGTGTSYFQQDRAFISGIRNASGTFDQDVCVDSSTDQLGPCSASSARFKEEIADLETDSEAVFDLRPVRFRYREDFAGEGEERPVQYGLIAEEVAEIYPHLVTYDTEGRPMTVRYDALTPLLLNELKKERRRNARQAAAIESLEGDVARLSALEDLVREQAARLSRLEALDAARERPAVVARR